MECKIDHDPNTRRSSPYAVSSSREGFFFINFYFHFHFASRATTLVPGIGNLVSIGVFLSAGSVSG